MLVIDASIAIKWFRSKDEQYCQQSIVLLKNHLRQIERIIVPSLLSIEVANTLVTKSDTTVATLQKDVARLNEFELDIEETHTKDVVAAAKLAKEYKTSVHDMLYAVIARKHDATLYTADGRFIKKTKFSFVHHIREVDVDTG